MEKGLTLWQLLAFIIIALMTAVLPLQGEEAKAPTQAEILAKPGVSKSLADGCEIVRLLNEGKMKAVKAKVSDDSLLMTLEQVVKVKDWSGIGAYRGSEWNAEENSVKHRFAYGAGKDAVHELWLTYPLVKGQFKKPRLLVLGW